MTLRPLCAAVLIVIGLPACDLPTQSEDVRIEGATGGSAMGDLGPARGDPVRAVLTV